ncbi:hypothetical protein [Spartinivicinus poritis]|uniref:Uncharacterized protein n=1 Tax=Spartinivicinus poritis TaxID=2994640 RepID=A0ABT5U440_9GAMM|nr:hypothetical protein [Spartinivicinus sp. A2-2]MDE1461135.1 hypothetical protein [Spartinivicinus sp. A2-2]
MIVLITASINASQQLDSKVCIEQPSTHYAQQNGWTSQLTHSICQEVICYIEADISCIDAILFTVDSRNMGISVIRKIPIEVLYKAGCTE